MIATTERGKVIGGSDIAAVMGLSRWKSPLKLWAEKTGKIEDSLSDFEAAEIGVELEDFVARKFERKTGLKVRRQPQEYKHRDHPYMVGHVDRLVLDGEGVLECKTTSGWNARQWEGDEIPVEFTLQTMWYLGLTGRKKGYIAVLIGGQRFLWKEIAFDRELFDRMVAAARHFMEEFVLKDQAPMAGPGDQETVGLVYPERGGVADLTPELEAEVEKLLDERAVGKGTLDETERKVDAAEARVKQILGESSSAETGRWSVSWRSQARKVADSAKMKAAGVFEEYSRTLESRVLRATERKGEPA